MKDRESFLEVDFSYVADPKLREVLQRFHSEAVSGYENKAYVAAVVLSGAVLEGLLTSALAMRESAAREEYQRARPEGGETQTEGRRGRAPRVVQWRLEELIDIAFRMGLIGRTSVESARAIRDFRNFIHPYKLLGRSRPRWDALAVMALGAVAEVSKSLAGRTQA